METKPKAQRRGPIEHRGPWAEGRLCCRRVTCLSKVSPRGPDSFVTEVHTVSLCFLSFLSQDSSGLGGHTTPDGPYTATKHQTCAPQASSGLNVPK